MESQELTKIADVNPSLPTKLSTKRNQQVIFYTRFMSDLLKSTQHDFMISGKYSNLYGPNSQDSNELTNNNLYKFSNLEEKDITINKQPQQDDKNNNDNNTLSDQPQPIFVVLNSSSNSFSGAGKNNSQQSNPVSGVRGIGGYYKINNETKISQSSIISSKLLNHSYSTLDNDNHIVNTISTNQLVQNGYHPRSFFDLSNNDNFILHQQQPKLLKNQTTKIDSHVPLFTPQLTTNASSMLNNGLSPKDQEEIIVYGQDLKINLDKCDKEDEVEKEKFYGGNDDGDDSDEPIEPPSPCGRLPLSPCESNLNYWDVKIDEDMSLDVGNQQYENNHQHHLPHKIIPKEKLSPSLYLIAPIIKRSLSSTSLPLHYDFTNETIRDHLENIGINQPYTTKINNPKVLDQEEKKIMITTKTSQKSNTFIRNTTTPSLIESIESFLVLTDDLMVIPQSAHLSRISRIPDDVEAEISTSNESSADDAKSYEKQQKIKQMLNKSIGNIPHQSSSKSPSNRHTQEIPGLSSSKFDTLGLPNFNTTNNEKTKGFDLMKLSFIALLILNTILLMSIILSPKAFPLYPSSFHSSPQSVVIETQSIQVFHGQEQRSLPPLSQQQLNHLAVFSRFDTSASKLFPSIFTTNNELPTCIDNNINQFNPIELTLDPGFTFIDNEREHIIIQSDVESYKHLQSSNKVITSPFLSPEDYVTAIKLPPPQSLDHGTTTMSVRNLIAQNPVVIITSFTLLVVFTIIISSLSCIIVKHTNKVNCYY